MREVLEISRQVEYFDKDGLRTLTGLSEGQWDYTIIKEIIDNGLDAINELKDKKIEICYDTHKDEDDDDDKLGRLSIYDSGLGIPEEVLDDIFDFNKYVSSKRFVKTPTRGFQGNALKTIIGICHIWNYKLYFVTEKKLIYYKINESKLKAGIVEFEKDTSSIDMERNGIVIDGVYDFNTNLIYRIVEQYYLSNPDVTFIIDDNDNIKTFPAITKPIKRTEKTFIQWYDNAAFNDLLQAMTLKDEDRTTRDFCLFFSGTQRLKLDGQFPKKLKEIADEEHLIDELHNYLVDNTKPPRSNILEVNLTKKENLFEIYDMPEENKYKYKKLTGEYEHNEALIPYTMEGFLLQAEDATVPNKVTCTVNNSVTYFDMPFYFEHYGVAFCGKNYDWADSLEDLLQASGFLEESRGLILIINFVSPYIQFTDKAKTKIISTAFQDDLIKLTEYLCQDTVKEVARKRRKNRAASKKTKPDKGYKSKEKLMAKYFWEAFEVASGGTNASVRQIFYTARKMINHELGVELNDSDYGTVSQKVVTDKIKEKPEYENRIFFERRGFFYDPFTDKEIGLSTYDVLKHIEYEGLIPDELKFGHVLFIEKAGFYLVLKESGLLKELNLGLMSTSGLANRASKRLMDFFINKGIKVYVLTDCDIPGYIIADKIKSGEFTFKKALDIEHIGLTVADVHALGKEDTAEEFAYKKGYDDALSILTEEEIEFLVIDKYEKLYRRVELNNLTTTEIQDFIRDKIKPILIKPDVEKLESFIYIDEDEIKKEAVYRAYKDKLKVDINKKEIAEEAYSKIEGKEHWHDVLTGVVWDYKENEIKRLVKQISEGNQENDAKDDCELEDD
ncbi:hypothetical protein ES705_06757 [subsurface metagenome]